MIHTKITENTLAGSYLDAYLGDQQLDLRLYVYYLATLSAAAETTRRQIPAPPPGRPHGTPNRPAFDLFVNSLMLAVEHCGGVRLKVFKLESKELADNRDGALVRAINLLRPWLPKDLVPKAPGRSLERIAKRLRAPTRKTPKRKN